MRETRSTLPPGGNDTTQRIGLVGHSCALAAVAANSAAKKTALIRPPSVIVGALQRLQLRAQERLARHAPAVVEHDLVGLARYGAARAAQNDEILGALDAVAGLAQLQAQVIRGLGCVVRGAVPHELRVTELLDCGDEVLDLARFYRGRHGESGARPDRDRSGEKRKGGTHR